VRTPSPIVLVVDADPSACASIERQLRAAGHRVRTYSSTQPLSQRGRPAEPCCLICDVPVHDVSGLQGKGILDRAGIRIPIIFTTNCGNIRMSVDAMKAGAVDFLPKPLDVAELLTAVERALALDARLLDQERRLADLWRCQARLTAREREVFFAVAGGLLNKQVGRQLGVTEKTIKVHRGRVMEKMRASSLAALVRMADLLQRQPDHADAAVAQDREPERRAEATSGTPIARPT
jgi:FixJ family two-component response regulator